MRECVSVCRDNSVILFVNCLSPHSTPLIYQGHKASSDYPCGICDEEVGDDDDGIYCESGCELWYHRTCTGMTVGAYKLLTTEVGCYAGVYSLCELFHKQFSSRPAFLYQYSFDWRI